MVVSCFLFIYSIFIHHNTRISPFLMCNFYVCPCRLTFVVRIPIIYQAFSPHFPSELIEINEDIFAHDMHNYLIYQLDYFFSASNRLFHFNRHQFSNGRENLNKIRTYKRIWQNSSGTFLFNSNHFPFNCLPILYLLFFIS